VTRSRAQASKAATAHVNEVRLVGRLAADPEERELPSGDVLVVFRLVVTRTPDPRAPGGRLGPSVDTLDCAAWRRSAQRVLQSCRLGDVLEVSGALRRRFWRGEHGAASRSEVEVLTVRRRARAAVQDKAEGASR
jgi:single-strand DNA-binding protein